MNKKLFTSESVTMGHPDKLCDRISDAILDEILKKDPYGRVACETCCTTGLVMVMGEISTKANVNISKVVRTTINEIGYSNQKAGFDGNSCSVLLSLDEQSNDIALGTSDTIGGAGDQGMMFGYACNETKDLMPLPITLANRLAYRLTTARQNGLLPFALPDGKTQVTIEYDENNKPYKVDTIVISTQHISETTDREYMEKCITETVIMPELKILKIENPNIQTEGYNLIFNPTGRFVKGGPAADAGLTGRKIIVDTYGGYGSHGGGAFSGKDPTKVDRSAAYVARHIAKNIVGSGISEKCQVQLAYAIGIAKPVSVRIDTFGTGKINDEETAQRVCEIYDLTPMDIINRFDLRKPIYKNTSSYGHFGSVIGEDRTWERLDMISDFKEML